MWGFPFQSVFPFRMTMTLGGTMVEKTAKHVFACPNCDAPMRQEHVAGIPVYACTNTNPRCLTWFYGPRGPCSSCETKITVDTCSLGQCRKHCELFHRKDFPRHITIEAYAKMLGKENAVTEETKAKEETPPAKKPEPKALILVTEVQSVNNTSAYSGRR